MAGLTYKDAGVDIEAGDRLVDRIRPLAASTRTPEVLGGVGGFAGLCSLPSDIEEPILVSGTDGVGTKLKLAFALARHDSIGIDLVAMCVNDVLTIGARPLFFLDYFATGALDVDQGEAVVRGIAEGCKLAGCALLGGETAELPGFYKSGEYDLAGFSVGVVGRKRIIDGKGIEAGDAIVALPSSGLHSNGYSLARRALLENAGLKLEDTPEGFEESLGDAMLRPTRIYAKAVAAALDACEIRGMCHVTGGGLVGNLPRILPDGLGANIELGSWDEPAIFGLLRTTGIAEDELRRTFNLGTGYLFVVAEDQREPLLTALANAGEAPKHIGFVREGVGIDYVAR